MAGLNQLQLVELGNLCVGGGEVKISTFARVLTVYTGVHFCNQSINQQLARHDRGHLVAHANQRGVGLRDLACRQCITNA